ncbi:MAG: septal ring lytic transglycosylase RlpA family protein, partial [Treponema sp.]|nr:septal ring lytic transglycosylase RlpA family protein [Treponema sp.]
MKNYVLKTAKPAVLGIGFLLLFASLLGASVWEGAAAVSSGGEFPDSGFYVATNSFPRNTVVDITNLETGKTVRGIVAANLDSPGLLAIISKECAEAVGLQNRSIGRIRMIQPADPIAFSRFGEENLVSGDPDYDPEAALKAYGESPDSAKAGAEPETQIAEPPVVAVIPHRPGKLSEDPVETEAAEETPENGEAGKDAEPLENAASETAVVAVPVEDPVPAEVPVDDPV